MDYRRFKHSIVANYFFAIVIFIISFIFLSKNIDKKMLWSDEAIAIAIINGVNINNVFKDIETSNLGSSTKNLNALLSEQANTNSLDVLLSVNIHPPIYFFLSSIGMRLFNLKNAPRITSAIAISFLSVLVFFLFMHFTKNTFYSFFSGVLFSLSPFFYIYGQEARPTALAISFNALFMCAFFLFFKNQNSKKYKVLFSVSAILSLLTSFLSFFILLVQFVFILVSPKKDRHKFIKKWAFWLLPAGIFLALWLPIFYEALQTKLLSCCNEKISFYYYLMGIGHVLSLSHFDMNILGSSGTVFTSSLYLLVIPIQFIILFFFLRGNKNNEKILLLLSASMPLLILLAIDIALGWKRALVPRFLYLTILSFWIINYIWLYSNLFKSNLKKKFVGILFGFFLFFGLLSFQKKYQQEVIWWHKNTQYRIVQLANLLKDTKYQKLVVKKELINFYFVVTLSKILERSVAIEWVTNHTDTRLRDAIYLGFEKSNLPNLVYTSSLEVSLEYMP